MFCTSCISSQSHRIGLVCVCVGQCGFERATLCTTSMVQDYVVPNRPALFTTRPALCTMVHTGNLCLWEAGVNPDIFLPPASAVEVIKTEASVCVCVLVCEHSHGWTNWRTVTKFGTGVDLDNISEEFNGQGRRSKVKVIQLKNVVLELWPRLSVL